VNQRLNIVSEFVGSTLRTTWVNSGTVASPISSALLNSSGTLVASIAQTSSGDGFYFADLTLPMSRQWLLNEQIAVIGVNTYRRFQLVHVQQPTVGVY
jgi:hypothetical protein